MVWQSLTKSQRWEGGGKRRTLHTLLKKIIFHLKQCSIKCLLQSKVVFNQRPSSIKDLLSSKDVFIKGVHQNLSSSKGCLSSKVVFRQRLCYVAPKNGVEFRQKSISAIRCSLATAYDDWRCCLTTLKLTGTDRQTGLRVESC